MSDRVVQTYNDTDGPTGQSIRSYQSVWMAHWTSTSCKAAPKVHNSLFDHCENREDDRDAMQHPLPSTLEIASDVSKCAEGFREVAEARTVNTMKEGLPMSMKGSRNERLDHQTFPMFNPRQNRESILARKNDPTTTHKQVLRSQVDYKSGYDATNLAAKKSHFPLVLAWAPPEEGTSSRECHFQSEGMAQNPEHQPQVHNFIEKNSLAVSKSLHDEFIGSSSNIVPNRFNNGRTSVLPLMSNQERVNPSNFISASKEHFKDVNLTQVEREHYNYESYSAFFVCGKKMQDQLKPGNSKFSLFRQNDKDLLLHDASTSNNELALFLEERWQKMQNPDGIELFPSRSSPLIVGELEKLNHRSCSQQKMPCSASARDVETTRICTAVDSLDGLGGCPPKFCQTTHHVVITKKNDDNLPKGGPIFRDSKVSPEFTGNTLKALLNLSPGFGSHGRHGVKLQPIEGSIDSQGKEDVGEVRISAINSKNESSAETDTMNMDAFQEENHLSGATSSPLNKDVLRSQNQQTSVATVAPAREFRGRLPNSDLPDMNQELPALPAPASSMDDKEASTSRTQSFDVDHILAHVEEPIHSKSSPYRDVSFEVDPSSRWVKRLRVSASDSFAHGTKTSKMGETSSNEKLNKFFSKIMKHKMPSSEFTWGRRRGKEPMELDQTAVLLRNGDSSSIDSLKKSQDITLSHSWIRRWCRNRSAAPKKKPDAVVVCEPQSSKAALDELQKKQFPSIAAMALMGKAMTSFHPCEFRKRGSLVVWDAKGFLR